MSDDVQGRMAAILARLGNAPKTAENLNRAQLQLLRPQEPSTFDMNAELDGMAATEAPGSRPSSPRRRQAPQVAAQAAPVPLEAPTPAPAPDVVGSTTAVTPPAEASTSTAPAAAQPTEVVPPATAAPVVEESPDGEVTLRNDGLLGLYRQQQQQIAADEERQAADRAANAVPDTISPEELARLESVDQRLPFTMSPIEAGAGLAAGVRLAAPAVIGAVGRTMRGSETYAPPPPRDYSALPPRDRVSVPMGSRPTAEAPPAPPPMAPSPTATAPQAPQGPQLPQSMPMMPRNSVVPAGPREPNVYPFQGPSVPKPVGVNIPIGGRPPGPIQPVQPHPSITQAPGRPVAPGIGPNNSSGPLRAAIDEASAARPQYQPNVPPPQPPMPPRAGPQGPPPPAPPPVQPTTPGHIPPMPSTQSLPPQPLTPNHIPRVPYQPSVPPPVAPTAPRAGPQGPTTNQQVGASQQMQQSRNIANNARVRDNNRRDVALSNAREQLAKAKTPSEVRAAERAIAEAKGVSNRGTRAGRAQ